MKSPKILILSILLASASLMSCSEQSMIAPVEKSVSAMPSIIGSWDWKETASFAGVRTPKSTGHSSLLVFSANGTLERYYDNELSSTTEYTVSGAGSTTQMHVSDEPDNVYTVKLDKDQLVLTASQEDAGTSKFAKK